MAKIIRLTLDIPVSVETNKAFVAAVNEDPDSVLFHALRRILAADAAALFESALDRARAEARPASGRRRLTKRTVA